MTDLAWQVFLVALLTDFATGLGALPFLFVGRVSERWQGIMSALAAGMMLSASLFALTAKGLDEGHVWQVVLGLLAGGAFFAITKRLVERTEWRVQNLSVTESRQAILVLVAMFIHSIPEGVAIGVGYATGELQFGLLLALAIAIHNVPEGLAVSLPLRSKGVSVAACAGYAILTSAPQPIAAVPAFLLVSVFKPLLPAGLGFAGGAMIFLVAAELIPESLSRCSRNDAAWSLLVGLIVMLWITVGIGL